MTGSSEACGILVDSCFVVVLVMVFASAVVVVVDEGSTAFWMMLACAA